MVIAGYYALRSIVSLFLNFRARAAQNEAEAPALVAEELAVVLRYIEEIPSTEYRLVILEDIYCLIFLNTHHLISSTDATASRTDFFSCFFFVLVFFFFFSSHIPN